MQSSDLVSHYYSVILPEVKVHKPTQPTQRCVPFVASNQAATLPLCTRTLLTSSFVALRAQGTDEAASFAPKLYQDAFLVLIFKKLFETTAKQSRSKASTTREESACQKNLRCEEITPVQRQG